MKLQEYLWLTVPAYQKRVPVRRVKPGHIYNWFCFGRIENLPDPQKRRSIGDLKELSGPSVSGSRVNLFVSIRERHRKFLFQDREKGSTFGMCARESRKISSRQKANLKRKGIIHP